MKNNKKCNEELAARVKAMINEDARISLKDTGCGVTRGAQTTPAVKG